MSADTADGTGGIVRRGGRWHCAAARPHVLPIDGMPMPDGPVPMDVVSGALFLTDRKGFLETLNGFDEDYFLHVEDIDLCRRAAEAGGAVIYQPGGAALHYGSTSKVPRTFVEKHKAAGMARYFQKFASSPLERQLARIAAPVFIALLVGRAKLFTLRGRFRPWLTSGRAGAQKG